MDFTTILNYRFKRSLITLGFFYLFFLGGNGLITFILTIFLNSYLPYDFHSFLFGGSFLVASLVFLSIFIGVTERANFHLFGQFNLSRKKHFFISYAHFFILASIMFGVHTLINGLIYLVWDINFYSLEPYKLFFQHTLLNLIPILLLIFMLFILAGSFGLFIAYLTLRFSALFVSLILIGASVASFTVLFDFVTFNTEGFSVASSHRFATLMGLTEQGVNPFHPISYILIFCLINLFLSKWISKSINIKKLGRP